MAKINTGGNNSRQRNIVTIIVVVILAIGAAIGARYAGKNGKTLADLPKNPDTALEENETDFTPDKEEVSDQATGNEDSAEDDAKTDDVDASDATGDDTDVDNSKDADDVGDSGIEIGQSSDYETVEIVYEFRKYKYLKEHFEKHGAEFDYTTVDEYLEGANRVIASEDALTKEEADDGDKIFYLVDTNEIVFLSKDGYIRSYFRPSAGIDYYNRQ